MRYQLSQNVIQIYLFQKDYFLTITLNYPYTLKSYDILLQKLIFAQTFLDSE